MKLAQKYGYLHLLLIFSYLSAETLNLFEPELPKLLPKLKSCSTNSLNNFNAGSGTTTLRPIVERVFLRKKRFLLATPKTRLKFTMQLGKKLLARFPSGFNFNIEAAVYYPMITSRLDLIPKRLRPKTTPKPKPKGPTLPLIIQIPGSLIRYKGKPATKPPKAQRIDESSQSLQWVDTKPVGPLVVPAAPPASAVSQYYTQPHKWQQWSKYGAPDYAQRYEWTPAKQWPDKQPVWLSQDTKWNKWTTTPLPGTLDKKWQQEASKWQQWEHTPGARGRWNQGGRWHRDTVLEEDGYQHAPLESDVSNESALNSVDVLEELDEIEPLYMHFPELEDHHEWKHYHNYRDRRQLYHQLNGLSTM